MVAYLGTSSQASAISGEASAAAIACSSSYHCETNASGVSRSPISFRVTSQTT